MTDDERRASQRRRSAKYRARHLEKERARWRACSKKWHATHRDESIAASKAYHEKHRAEVLPKRRELWALRSEADRAEVRKSWLRNREKRNAQRRLRRAADIQAAKQREAAVRARPGYSERAVARTAEWNRQHPEHARLLRLKEDAKRRAREREVFVEAVDHRVVFDRDKGICGICKLDVDHASPWEVDHIVPISKGGLHSYANVQLAHRSCNRRKHIKLICISPSAVPPVT